MSTSRIDHLRNLVANIGAKQIEYHQFFPLFANRLEQELGDYVGSRESVALCCAYGDFSFDHRYRPPASVSRAGGTEFHSWSD